MLPRTLSESNDESRENGPCTVNLRPVAPSLYRCFTRSSQLHLSVEIGRPLTPVAAAAIFFARERARRDEVTGCSRTNVYICIHVHTDRSEGRWNGSP